MTSNYFAVSDKLALAPSTIPNAGWGIFATSFIPKSTYLGRYKGRKLNSEIKFIKLASSGRLEPNYAFDVNSGEGTLILDATEPKYSNWTRYINCSRHDAEENVIYIDQNGEIDFFARKPLYPGTELLFYYGELYAKKLGHISEGV